MIWLVENMYQADWDVAMQITKCVALREDVVKRYIDVRDSQ